MHDSQGHGRTNALVIAPMQWQRPDDACGPVRNQLLAGLGREHIAKLSTHLHRVPLQRHQVLHERRAPIAFAYFIERGLASLSARVGERHSLEVGMIGASGVAGMPIVLGIDSSPHRCVIQIPGEALRISTADLRRAIDDIPALRTLLLAHAQAAFAATAQLVVCNTRHRLVERVARWLSIAHDNGEGNELAVTHDILSRALGVRRASVTDTLLRLERGGVLHRGRAELIISDREKLEELACDCSRLMRADRRGVHAAAINGAERLARPTCLVAASC